MSESHCETRVVEYPFSTPLSHSKGYLRVLRAEDGPVRSVPRACGSPPRRRLAGPRCRLRESVFGQMSALFPPAVSTRLLLSSHVVLCSDPTRTSSVNSACRMEQDTVLSRDAPSLAKKCVLSFTWPVRMANNDCRCHVVFLSMLQARNAAIEHAANFLPCHGRLQLDRAFWQHALGLQLSIYRCSKVSRTLNSAIG